MKKIIISCVLLSQTLASAESWTGADKTQHAIVGAAIGSLVTMATEDPLLGCAAATLAGAAKEAYDSKYRATHTASFKDFAAAAVIGCIAAKGTSLVISPGKVMFRWEF